MLLDCQYHTYPLFFIPGIVKGTSSDLLGFAQSENQRNHQKSDLCIFVCSLGVLILVYPTNDKTKSDQIKI
jgi:hypothetical protein